jgi:hypothetical protein
VRAIEVTLGGTGVQIFGHGKEIRSLNLGEGAGAFLSFNLGAAQGWG